MKREILIKVFLLLVAIPTLMVGLQGLTNPQAIMDNVDVILGNNSGKSSTRAIYGGMHLMFGGFFVYGAFKMQREALMVVALYTIGFVMGRVVSLVLDGSPNAFISTWIYVEAGIAVIATWFLMKR